MNHHAVFLGNAFDWSPGTLLAVALVAGLYLFVTSERATPFSAGEKPKRWRKACFVMGLAVYAVAKASPLHALGMTYLFSAHMLEQSLIYLVMPPLLLLGVPQRWVRPLFAGRWGRFLCGFTQPILAVLCFNVLFSLYHLPLVFDAVSARHGLHAVYHTILMVAAFQMWWPVVSQMPETARLSHLRKMAYIFANGVLLTPACALIIFAQTPLYETYRHGPHLFTALPPLDDQQLGGVIMKLVQEAAYGTALGCVFYQWFHRENPRDPLPDLPTGDELWTNRHP